MKKQIDQVVLMKPDGTNKIMSKEEFESMLEQINTKPNPAPVEEMKVPVVDKKEEKQIHPAFQTLGSLLDMDLYNIPNMDEMFEKMAPISPIYYENNYLISVPSPYDAIICNYRAMLDNLKNDPYGDKYIAQIKASIKSAIADMYSNTMTATLTSYFRATILPKLSTTVNGNVTYVIPGVEQLIANVCRPGFTGAINNMFYQFEGLGNPKYYGKVLEDSEKNLIKYNLLYNMRNRIGVDVSNRLMEFARQLAFLEVPYHDGIADYGIESHDRNAYIDTLNKEDSGYDKVTPDIFYTLQSVEYTCIMNQAMALIEMILIQAKMTYDFLGIDKIKEDGWDVATW